MKCPKCNYNQKYKYGMTCSRCQYRFLLDPKNNGYTDNKFITIINKLRQQGEGYFTFHQFYALLFRSSKRFGGLVAIFFVGFVAFCIIAALAESILLGLGIVILLGLLIRSAHKSHFSKAPDRTSIRRFWDRWNANTVIPVKGFLSEPGFTNTPSNAAEEDLYDYGVEGILIVDQPIYVDLLVRNKVHSEFRLLVMASDTYPTFLLEKANALLAERADLPVYLLHDATAIVSRMTTRFNLRDHRVYDLGLSLQMYENHPRLSPFGALAEKPLDVLSLNELRVLLRRATQRTENGSDSSDDGGWVIFGDTDHEEEGYGGSILVMSTFFDDAMADSDADGSDFG